MEKGQGSIEYLLILGAVIGLTVVVILVARGAIFTSRESGNIDKEKMSCELHDVKLLGYEDLYTGTEESAPEELKLLRLGKTVSIEDDSSSEFSGEKACKIGGKYEVFVNETDGVAYLETKQASYIRYGAPKIRPKTFWPTDEEKNSHRDFCGGVDSDDDNAFELKDSEPMNLTFDLTGVTFDKMNLSLYKSATISEDKSITIEGAEEKEHTLEGPKGRYNLNLTGTDLANEAKYSEFKVNISTDETGFHICANCSDHKPKMKVWNTTG